MFSPSNTHVFCQIYWFHWVINLSTNYAMVTGHANPLKNHWCWKSKALLLSIYLLLIQLSDCHVILGSLRPLLNHHQSLVATLESLILASSLLYCHIRSLEILLFHHPLLMCHLCGLSKSTVNPMCVYCDSSSVHHCYMCISLAPPNEY